MEAGPSTWVQELKQMAVARRNSRSKQQYELATEFDDLDATSTPRTSKYPWENRKFTRKPGRSEEPDNHDKSDESQTRRDVEQGEAEDSVKATTGPTITKTGIRPGVFIQVKQPHELVEFDDLDATSAPQISRYVRDNRKSKQKSGRPDNHDKPDESQTRRDVEQGEAEDSVKATTGPKITKTGIRPGEHLQVKEKSRGKSASVESLVGMITPR